MTQAQAVIETIDKLGGIATLNQINQHIFEIEECAWKTKTPFASIRFKGRQVRCNSEELTKASHRESNDSAKRKNGRFHRENDDWRSLMGKVPRELKGEEPDFSEEGWARRRPKKK